jgi:hypothetical protein
MTHRRRNTLAAFLAAGLLVLTAVSSQAMAWGGRHPGWGDPHPKTSLQPKASHTAKPTHSFKIVSCKPTATPTPTPTAVSVAQVRPGFGFGMRGWKVFQGWMKDFDKTACTVDALRTSSDARIAKFVKSLQGLDTRIGKIAALTAGEKAGLTAEVNGEIADLNALKTKIDGETTIAAIQADLAALANESVYIRSISLQIGMIGGAENILASLAKLDAQVATFTTEIAAAPAGIDTAAAQKSLDDLKTRIAEAKSLVSPLPASLLALTEAQLRAGKADPTVAAAFKAYWRASFDTWMARRDAWVVQWILAGKPGFDGDKDHDKTPHPTATPTPTPTPV